MQDPELIRRLPRARDRIDAASHEEWPVSRLARVSGVSAAHLARSFKEPFGVPPHRYLLTRRIERASALLRDSELTVTEIALATGWKSLGTFGRTFRDVTGESPGELRARAPAVGLGYQSSGDQLHGGDMTQGVGVMGIYVRDQDEALGPGALR